MGPSSGLSRRAFFRNTKRSSQDSGFDGTSLGESSICSGRRRSSWTFGPKTTYHQIRPITHVDLETLQSVAPLKSPINLDLHRTLCAICVPVSGQELSYG